jgi:hypothetical protein
MKKLIQEFTQTDLPVAGGIIGAHLVTKNLAPMIPYIKDNDKLQPVVGIAAGLLLKRFGGKNPMIKNLGTGMIGYGIAATVGKFVPAVSITGMSEEEINGVINDVINDGIEGVEQEYAEMMNGTDDNPLNDYSMRTDDDEDPYN